ncbi:MAG: VCBS repeat-containing protein [Enhygromyxa sp.]
MTLALACLACVPGRIAAEGEDDGSASATGSTSESEDGPIVETGEGDSDSGDSDSGDDGPWGPGGCDSEGSLKWLDICDPGDPCDRVSCPAPLACLGGQCIEPAPTQACAGIELVDFTLPVEPHETGSGPLFADVDGVVGDELISARGLDGRIEVVIAGELVASWIMQETIHRITPMQLDGDGQLALLAYSYTVPPITRLLVGDGQGKFDDALAQLPDGVEARWPMALDYDNDGDHDILAQVAQLGAQVYRNEGGAFAHVATFGVDTRVGTAVDLDLDGFVDDAIFGGYPSPSVLLGEDGELSYVGELPEPERGPLLQYGVGRPLAADLDDDGFVEVVTVIADGFGRIGARIWWGLPNDGFDLPRDQLLFDDYHLETPSLVGFVDLDGQPPLELLIRRSDKLHYARPELENRLPLACVATLLEGSFHVDPTIGDLDADGSLEIGLSNSSMVEVFSVVQP